MKKSGVLSVVAAVAIGSVGCPGSAKTGAGPEEGKTVPAAKSGEGQAESKTAEGQGAESKSAQGAAAKSEAGPGAKEGGVIEVVRTFEGRVNVPPAGLGGGGSPTRVIQDAEGLESFRGAIPKKKIQRQNPAPPSDDPLLGDAGIDWATQTLLVVRRGDTMYIHPTVDRIEARGEGAHVVYTYPPLGDSAMAAAVIDMGTYTAVLVRKIKGEVSFERSAGSEEPKEGLRREGLEPEGPEPGEEPVPETGEEEH